MVSRQKGMLLTDALIAVLVLSISVVVFTKNWTSSSGAQSSTYLRSIAAAQVAEIGNVMLAHISDLDQSTPRDEVRSRVRSFARELERHVHEFARARGHECRGNLPSPLDVPDMSIRLDESTLLRIWAQGPASCIQVTPMPGLSTDTNGVWVRIEAIWFGYPHRGRTH